MVHKIRELQGLRVIDFTIWLAGPYSTMILAQHGAEVIKIEKRQYGDGARLNVPFVGKVTAFGLDGSAIGQEENLNRSATFLSWNREKNSVTLDVTKPKGIEILKKLISVSDVLVENQKPELMSRLGLDYEEVKKIKPDIIMVRSCGYGHTGPYANFSAYGASLQAISGHVDLCGFPDRDPVGSSADPSDYAGGWMTTAAILMALHHRNETGKGMYIEMTQLENWCAGIMGIPFLDYSVNGRVAARAGNRLPSYERLAAPHGAYRCKGEDRWCVIAIFSEGEWEAFCKTIGEPEWTKEERFATIHSRMQNADGLDALIEQFTMVNEAEKVMEMLQEVGVAAGVVQEMPDLYNSDPQLKEYDFWIKLDHSEVGSLIAEGEPYRLSKTPAKATRAAPLLGEHNDLVYGKILGMSEGEINQLIIDEVI